MASRLCQLTRLLDTVNALEGGVTMTRTTMRRAVAITAAAVTVTGGALISAGVGSSAAPDTKGKASASAHGWPASSSSARTVMRQARSAASEDGGAIIAVVERQQRQRYLDAGATGESPGDSFMWEGALFTPGGERVGRDVVVCTLGIRTYLCNGTLRMPDSGKIQVNGAFFGNESVIPITGGTKDYRDAAGEMFAVDMPDGTSRLIFHLVG